MLNPDDYLTDPYTPEGIGSDGTPVAPPAAAAPPATPTTPATGPKPGDKRYPDGPQGQFYEEWDGTKWVQYSNSAWPGNKVTPPETNFDGTARDSGQPTTGGVATIGQPSWGESGPFDPYQSSGPFVPRDGTLEYQPFNYDPYTQSSWEDAENEPGFKESQGRLRKEIEAGAAYRGMLRSGMTLTDLDTGLGSSRRQNFESFDSRRFRNYSANRDNAYGAWASNFGAAKDKFGLEYGVDRDVYDRGATDVDRANNYRFNVANSKFQDALARWQEQVRSMTSIATAGSGS